MLKAHRIGAIFYTIWGVLHLPIGYSVYTGGLELESGIVQGRVLQMGFYLNVAGLVAIAIARWNWVNNDTAYWANFWLTTIIDVGILSFLLFPGYVSLIRGLPAPITWVLGVVFTTIGHFQAGNTRRQHNKNDQADKLKVRK